MPWSVKANGDKFCVYKKGEDTPIKGGCHTTREAAEAHKRALYANTNESYSRPNSYMFSFAGVTQHTRQELMDGVWIQATPYDTVQHPIFGEVTMSPERAGGMKEKFDARVFGKDIKISFEHFGIDKAKGYKAAGWVKEVEPRDDGFWWRIAFTGEAADEILDGAWRYFSAEWDPEFTNSHGDKYEDVIIGGALTNDPFFDGTIPLNFSKVLAESADWEHSEPGTGPTPRETGDDEGTAQGVRGPDPTPPPEAEIPDYLLEDSMKPEELAELRKKLGLPEDGDITVAVEGLLAEVQPIRDAGKKAEEALTFSKQFPAEYERLQQLEESNRNTKGSEFAQSYSKVRVIKSEGDGDDKTEVETGMGFSALTLDKIKEAHVAMSTGAIKEEHLKGLLDSIVGKDTGLVDYSEKGSSINDDSAPIPTGKDAGEAFSNKIAEYMVNDKLTVRDATQHAAEQHPELYAEYRKSVGAVT